MSIFDFFKKSKKADLIKENKYLDTVLANGKTIREQQEIAFHQALGEFDEDIPTFNGMHIVSNTIPPKEDYEKLNNAEKIFFEEFSKQLINNKYKPEDVKLTRLSDGTLNVDYIPMCYTLDKQAVCKSNLDLSISNRENGKCFSKIRENILKRNNRNTLPKRKQSNILLCSSKQ